MGNMIGIDAGSKTIKVVVLDGSGALLYSLYRRHRADIRETVQEALHDLAWRYGDIEGSVAVTGSAGIGLSESLGLPFVQEVVATTHMVTTAIPDADAIIELGGEDAKVVYISGGLEQRMNASCAGGTGGFIDTIAFMLGARTQDMSSLAMGASRTYPIASRCAVFAQTDVRPLLYSGAKKADIAASALEAVVRQTITGLACGRPIKGTVVFLGGPLEHIPDLVSRFRRALGLTYKTGIKPPDAHLFTAMGAALLGPGLLERQGREAVYSLTGLERRLAMAPPGGNDLSTLPPLFSCAAERDAFMARHHGAKTPRKRLSECTGPLYLGIDAGSTTVKFVAVDKEGGIAYSDYQPTEGDTLKTASLMLEELYRLLPHEYNGPPLAWIGHATVTGYGEGLLKAAFGLDSGMVETVAHLRAARELYPETDFILDIGGQDMKALWLKDGAIVNAVLNEACSSGCGSFIEGTAYSLRFNRYSFAEAALSAQAPVDLGIKCTVFMTSRVRHAQKTGVPYEEIAAGLAYSVVKNALFKIIGMNSIDEMGGHIVVQGGAFMSDAVLRAFELVSGVEVTRPDIAHLMGAFGAALTALSRAGSSPAARSTLIPLEELKALDPARRAQRCTGCSNNCLLTVMEFGGGRCFVDGNRCPRAFSLLGIGAGAAPSPAVGPSPSPGGGQKGLADGEGAGGLAAGALSQKAPNLYQLEQRLLARYGRRGVATTQDGAGAAQRPASIGIPRVLNLYESLPFWYTFFDRLGLAVVLPPSTADDGSPGLSRPPMAAALGQSAGYAQADGLETVPSESVCFPAKTAHLHIAELLHAGIDAVFMPVFDRGSRCPVSSGYGKVLASNIPELASGEAVLVSPELEAIRPERICESPKDRKALLDAVNSLPGLGAVFSQEAFDQALGAANKEQEAFLGALARGAQKALSWIRATGGRGIVLAGRPYHVDGAASHGIDTLLTELGFAVLSPAGLRPLLPKGVPDAASPGQPAPPDVWRPARTLKRLARFVSTEPGLDLVCLYSFGCGFDALSLASAQRIIEGAGKVFTALKIDEIVDLAHIRIRLRTLAETLEDRGLRMPGSLGLNKDGGEKPVLGPQAPGGPARPEAGIAGKAGPGLGAPYAAGGAQRPYKEARLGGLSPEDIECGRALVNNDACFVVSAIAGAAINLLRHDPAITRLVVPYVCSDCLLDDVPDLVFQALGWAPEVIWENAWDGPAGPSEGRVPEDSAPPFKAPGPAVREGRHALAGHQGGKGLGPAPQKDRPPIGILGNALLCFDEEANHHVAGLIAELGCSVAYPAPQALFTDDVRYIDQIKAFMEQGVCDIIYLQAFGCLKGHIDSRGALRGLVQQFPGLHMTIVDFDHDLSTLNQENRIRLALAAAGQY